jgi:ribosomal protein S18 acetylase RimI-like enzyme
LTSIVTLVPMIEAEYRAWVPDAVSAYAADKVASGQWPEAESLKLASQSLDSLLPQRLKTPDHYLFAIRGDSTVSLGMLWIALQTRAAKRIAYVYDAYIEPLHRRRGYASAAFLALEGKAAELGFSGISLHVFGHNSAAQALYAKLGFIATDINMFKSVELPKES